MFLITLDRLPSTCTADSVPRHEYDPENDDLFTMLSTICDVSEDMQLLKLSVGGFGQDIWPVDVRYDLPFILDQIGPVLTALDGGERANLDFPEQGLQRRVVISPTHELVELECLSDTDWVPQGESTKVSYKSLREALIGVWQVFDEVVNQVFPGEYQHPWFVLWHTQMQSLAVRIAPDL